MCVYSKWRHTTFSNDSSENLTGIYFWMAVRLNGENRPGMFRKVRQRSAFSNNNKSITAIDSDDGHLA